MISVTFFLNCLTFLFASTPFSPDFSLPRITRKRRTSRTGPTKDVQWFQIFPSEDFLKELDDTFPELAIYKQGRIQTSPGVEDVGEFV